MEEIPKLGISVIIPTYNRAQTIKKAIQSAQNQSYPVGEIIVVDDASSDETGQIVQSINDDRIRYFFLKKNKGAAGARNIGVSQAQYNTIAFLDSDDAWHPDKLEKQMTYLISHKECRLIYSAYVRHYPSFDMVVPDIDTDRKLEGNILTELLVENTVSTQTILMTRELFVEVGGFDDSLRSLEDWDLVIRCAKLGPLGFIPEVLVDAEYLDDALTSNMSEYFKSRCLMMQKYRQEYLATGTFNIATINILEMAQKFNMLDSVQAMLLQSISS